MAMPVVTVASGGIPVVDVTATAPQRGTPVTESANGIGTEVTKVTSGLGMPVMYVADSNFWPGAGPPVFPSVPPNGLTHDWQMDNAHVSGTTVTDLVGSLNGTINNATHVTSGTYGRNFDGSGYISLASSPIANFATAHSVFAWVNITNAANTGGSGSSQTMLEFSTDASNGLRFAVNEGGTDAFVASEFVVSLLKAGTNVGISTWNDPSGQKPVKSGVLVLIGYTYDGTTIIPYCGEDSFFVTPEVNFGLTIPGNLIGARATALTGSTTGLIGRVLTYNRVITPAEVQQIHRAGPVGIPSRKHTMRLTGVGASNMVPNSYFEYTLSSLQPGLLPKNVARSGETFAHYDANFATWVQPYFDSNRDMNLLVLQCTNDMDANSLTGVATEALTASIANRWRALGSSAKVLVMGAWNFGGNTAFIQAHADYNAAVATHGAFYDGYVDVWNIPGLNTGTTPPSTTLTPDNNHLTKAGHQLVAPYLVTGINAIWNS